MLVVDRFVTAVLNSLEPAAKVGHILLVEEDAVQVPEEGSDCAATREIQ